MQHKRALVFWQEIDCVPIPTLSKISKGTLCRKHEIKKEEILPVCLCQNKKMARPKRPKEFCLVWAKKVSRATKAHIFIIKKCGWKNLEKNQNAVSASRLKIWQSCCNTRRGKMMMENTVKNRGNDWKGQQSRQAKYTFVEKLNEVVCCRVCYLDETSRKRKLQK